MAESVLDIIKDDHKLISQCFKQLLSRKMKKQGVKALNDAWHDLRRMISLHSLLEEDNLYPSLKGKTSSPNFLRVASVQHRVADKIVGKLERESVGSKTWFELVRELRAVMDEHMALEEDELSRILGVALTQKELSILSARLKTGRAA